MPGAWSGSALRSDLGLGEDPSIELRGGAPRDPGAMRDAVVDIEGQAEDRSAIATRCRERRIALEEGDLQRAHDATRVAQVDAGRAGRRDGLESSDEGIETTLGEIVLQRRADVRVPRQRVEGQPIGDRAQPEPGPADQDRDARTGGDARQHALDMIGEIGHREQRVGVHEVEPVVRDATPFGRGRLGRRNVGPTVDLARVGRDHLGVDAVVREREREANGDLGLAGRGGPADDEQARSRQTGTPLPWRQARIPRRL